MATFNYKIERFEPENKVFLINYYIGSDPEQDNIRLNIPIPFNTDKSGYLSGTDLTDFINRYAPNDIKEYVDLVETLDSSEIDALVQPVTEESRPVTLNLTEEQKLLVRTNIGAQAELTIDDTVTEDSENPVKSSGIYDSLSGFVPETRTINGKALTEDITLTPADIGASEDSIPKLGDRGTLGGYEKCHYFSGEGGFHVDKTKPDCIAFGNMNQVGIGLNSSEEDIGLSWTKIIILLTDSEIQLGTDWYWANGSVPTITAGMVLVCNWMYNKGVVSYTSISDATETVSAGTSTLINDLDARLSAIEQVDYTGIYANGSGD